MKPSSPNYNHPFTPYDIQLDFMQKLYQCIEDKCVSIFESPTGTGKSLSLVCAALTWLRDDQDRALLDASDDTGLDWLEKAERANQRKTLLETRQELEQKLADLRAAQSKSRPEQRYAKKPKLDNQLQEDELLLDEYESDRDDLDPRDGLSASTKALLDQLQPVKAATAENLETTTQIIFCSRTHSQLSQLVGELQKLTLRPSVEGAIASTIKQIPLGSRKNMCINPKVSRLTSNIAINERCLELQSSRAGTAHKCEFMPAKHLATDEDRLRKFADTAIASVQDIEDITNLGTKMKLCPYYAARAAVSSAEILTLPYPLLLQKSAREASGIKLRNNVVIIDEAHNLKGAIADTFNVSMSLSHLEVAKAQLLGYCQHFKNKLKGKNRVYIAQIIKVIKSCIQALRCCTQQPQPDQVLTASSLLSGTGDDLIHLQKLIRYLHESKLVFKVEGYAEVWRQQQGQAPKSTDRSQHEQQQIPKGVLAEFQSLLVALTNTEEEGRFYAKKDADDWIITYELLDPQAHFQGFVSEARAVVLAGGTMSPMEDWSFELFPTVAPNRLRTFSFGHIVDKSNVFVQPVTRIHDGGTFRFDYKNRYDTKMLEQLGSFLEELCKVVPDGVIVFFASYDYLAHVSKTWQSTATGRAQWDRIASIKPVYQETKTTATDELLRLYSEKIHAGSGAILFAVVGGKLSEGINFSDKLGRGVVCVGLPYPNIQCAEWKERLALFHRRHCEQLNRSGVTDSDAQSQARLATKEYLENLVMRTINQSIGRAIRHKNDFAAIFLIDQRYAAPSIQKKLPAWLLESVKTEEPQLGELCSNLRRFFETKKT